jgi:hypothetical protein
VTRCYLAFTAFAAALGLFSGQPVERCWGICAAIGYTAAAAVRTVARRRERTTIAGHSVTGQAGQFLAAAALTVALGCALMTVFGLPAAAGLPGWPGDPRLWLTLAGSAGFFAAFAIAGAGTRRALRCTAVALASPVISLQVATGGTDFPVIALLCVSLALAADRPAGAAVATGIACALKATAWPAVHRGHARG